MNQDQLKQQVGNKAVDLIHDQMIVGLGTGSTVKYLVEALGEKIKHENLTITGVVTSKATAALAQKCGISLKTVDQVDHIDLTIDGADEISSDYQGIKGGGAALLFEKIVATNSQKNIWIVDQSKLVDKLGKFPLPVEVIPYGSQKIFERFVKEDYQPTFRLTSTGQKKKTDSGNYIIDLHLQQIKHPHQLALKLKRQVGVVEQGLFLDLVNMIIVGTVDGPKIIQAR
ncbi:ribose-5-phosphate isomerase RpiA [Liquorilactobacillus vini]|uniref:Ribose-5-phosphate isomerase A n=1 Tax=Liquorilactobacillus vini DSM 20605 TaxID=1133569 RepID=A0A0R2CK93_9LACO|nr:ribose-5-phosphate isomerase RpiA [Liquorilactobacillus vini]KRM88843.1 ribose-5-phosphate isomerase A [Liquorilactobacillus vini DSM 20605]